MTTPRIEEIKAEFQMFVPDDDGSAMDWLENTLTELLTEAHQAGKKAGIDEAVEKMEKEIDGKLEMWAALEHSRWSKWQEYLHSKLYEIDDNRVSANNHLKITYGALATMGTSNKYRL